MSIMTQMKFNHFIKKVRREDDYDEVIEYVKKHKDLSRQQLFNLAKLLCESKEACYLVEFIKVSGITDEDICCLHKIGQALSLTDSAHFINEFITMFPKSKITDKLIHRLCELKNIDHLYNYLDKEYVKKETKRKIVSTIIEYGSIKQISELAHYYDILTPEECNSIICRVCNSLEPHYICLVSFLFVKEEKEPFVKAICQIKNAEMLYCFMAANELNDSQITDIVSAICDTNNLEYIYRSLLLLGNACPNLRKMLMTKIKESGDFKYMMLMVVYADKDYLIKRFDFVQSIYDKAVMTEDIFTDKEFVDMHRHLQKVKIENIELINQKKEW